MKTPYCRISLCVYAKAVIILTPFRHWHMLECFILRALLNFLYQQRSMTYVRPLRISQLILRRSWVASFPISTGWRDSACLPSSGLVRGPQRRLRSATKLLRKLKSHVSAFSLSNWVCLDFTFKAECVFSFISLWEIVCPLYQFMNVSCVKLKCGALLQTASQTFFFLTHLTEYQMQKLITKLIFYQTSL